jgi:hypothetical protein
VRQLPRLRAVPGFALAVVLLLAVPATALAGNGFDLKFQLPASNGYKMTVAGYDATAVITAAKPGRSHDRAWSTYITRGKVSPTAIDASLGALGHVGMRFHPSGGVTYGKRHKHCIGADRYTIQPGVFVGSINFRGEGGYTLAKVHRVKGKVVTPRVLKCLDSFFEEFERIRHHKPSAKKPKVTRLNAFMRSGLTAVLFGASERGGKAGYLAEIEQTVGSLGVFRGAFIHASPATFAFDNALSFAGVTPPPPFSGSGSFQREPTGAKVWAGSLADPRFKTQLTRSW